MLNNIKGFHFIIPSLTSAVILVKVTQKLLLSNDSNNNILKVTRPTLDLIREDIYFLLSDSLINNSVLKCLKKCTSPSGFLRSAATKTCWYVVTHVRAVQLSI